METLKSELSSEIADKFQIESKLPIVGKINFSGFKGEVAETIDFTDKNLFLATIKKEIDYNPDGFKAYPLSKDPELLKAVDDIYYGNCGAENPHSLEWYKSGAHEISVVKPTAENLTSPVYNESAISVDPYIKKLNESQNGYLGTFIENGKTDFKDFQIQFNDKFILTGDFKLITENGEKFPQFSSLTYTDRMTGKNINCMPVINKLNEKNVDFLKLSPFQREDLFSKNYLNITEVKGKELFTKSLTDKPFNLSITRVGGKMFAFSSKIMTAFSKINEAVMG